MRKLFHACNSSFFTCTKRFHSSQQGRSLLFQRGGGPESVGLFLQKMIFCNLFSVGRSAQSLNCRQKKNPAQKKIKMVNKKWNRGRPPRSPPLLPCTMETHSRVTCYTCAHCSGCIVSTHY